ncbi:MAG: porin [Gemmatimonadota bacterium]
MRPKLAATITLLSLLPGVSLDAQEPIRYPTIRPNGRLQADAAFYREDKKDLSNGTEIRRARLAVAGDLTAEWSYQLELDLADDDAKVRDAWVMYRANEMLRLQLGNYKEPFSLDGITSSRFTSFIERSLIDAFVPPRHFGAAVRTNFRGATASIGIFGQEPGDLGEDDLQDSEGWGAAARGTFAPVLAERRLVHIGAAVRHRTPDAQEDDETALRFRGYSETHVDRTRFYDTGNLPGSDHYQQLDVEGAVVFGALSLQGERVWTRVNRTAGPSSTLVGSYVYASFFPTGEHRTYDTEDGEFLGITPRRSLGAVELLLRYSTLDLNDGIVTGGSGHNWTAGANWYVARNLRFMVNYVITNHDALATANGDAEGDDDFSALYLRLQFHF